jgi:hypothetical protein
LATGSSWGLITDWIAETEPFEMSRLQADALGLLSGTVLNPLPIDLRECGVCYGRWYFPLGDLPAGARQTLHRGREVRDLHSHLVRRRILDDKEVTAAWNKLDTDLRRLGEVLMFHQAVQGEDYTGLRHEHLARLDFSDQIRIQSAILMARSEQPLTDWRVAASSSSPSAVRWGRGATFVRLLIPVDPAPTPDN